MLSTSDQQAIESRLRGAQEPVYFSNRALDNYVEKLEIQMKGTLPVYLRDDYRTLFSLNGFYFGGRQQSARIAINVAELFTNQHIDSTDAPVLWRAAFVINGEPTEVRLASLDHPFSTLSNVNVATPVSLTPIDLSGRPIGPSLQLPVSRSLQGLYQFEIMTHHSAKSADYRDRSLQVVNGQVARVTSSPKRYSNERRPLTFSQHNNESHSARHTQPAPLCRDHE